MNIRTAFCFAVLAFASMPVFAAEGVSVLPADEFGTNFSVTAPEALQDDSMMAIDAGSLNDMAPAAGEEGILPSPENAPVPGMEQETADHLTTMPTPESARE